jgi:ABC-type Fe3+ transport system permease subunit
MLTDLFFLLPLAIPPTVLGLGMIRTWNRPSLEWLMESALILLVAYCAQFVPFVVAPVASSMARVSPQLEEAGLLSGLGWSSRIRAILLPAVWPGVAAGWLLAFAFSLDEVGASILLAPPDSEVLAVRIYNLSHYGATEMVGGLCLVVLGVVGVALLGYALLLRWCRQRYPAV